MGHSGQKVGLQPISSLSLPEQLGVVESQGGQLRYPPGDTLLLGGEGLLTTTIARALHPNDFSAPPQGHVEADGDAGVLHGQRGRQEVLGLRHHYLYDLLALQAG